MKQKEKLKVIEKGKLGPICDPFAPLDVVGPFTGKFNIGDECPEEKLEIINDSRKFNIGLKE